MKNVATQLLKTHGVHDSFYIAHTDMLLLKIQQWTTLLPYVKPYYAMKCNPDVTILKTMIENGFGFDCASKKEIKTVLLLGANPEHIGFFHPVKSPHDLLYAFSNNIYHTSFDNLSELDKIHNTTPEMKCLIRLKVDNPTARVQLGRKYGARVDEYKELIDYACKLKLDIVGTTFHVGSASKDPEVFEEGIKYSRNVFDYVKQKGYLNCHILDIGGGFTSENFEASAEQINKSINKHFNDIEKITVIAEPGRYFAEQFYTFFVSVMGLRKRDGIMQYWVKDGLYGSFNAILYDQQMPEFEVYRSPFLEPVKGVDEDELHESEIMFETCDSCDRLENKLMLPKLRVGDYLMVRNFGAYTLSAATDFNGINMTNPKIFHV
jgi:ornithine decarboxylase